MNKLVWNVYRYDFNEHKIKVVNVFNLNWVFSKEIYKAKKKYSNNFISFSKAVKDALMFSFWCRCEYEIIIEGFFQNLTEYEKVDIYDQIMLNYNNFIKYLWENKKYIRSVK